jgi:CRP-like cAMP-binding protein
MALTLLSVEERLLLIDASTPLQGLSRLQKLVLAVSMQVWIFPKGTEITRCEEDASGIFLLIQGSARSYPGAPALYSKLPNASFDLELLQYFGALPDTQLNMRSTYVFTVKAMTHTICAVWTAKEFSLQLTSDMTQMIVAQVSDFAVLCMREWPHSWLYSLLPWNACVGLPRKIPNTPN